LDRSQDGCNESAYGYIKENMRNLFLWVEKISLKELFCYNIKCIFVSICSHRVMDRGE